MGAWIVIGGRPTLLLAAALALIGAAFVVARTHAPPAPGPIAEAEAGQDSCTANCNAQWNRCRINTKGSASCDAQRAACMQACMPRKK